MDVVRRGFDPMDDILFGRKSLEKLQTAAQELTYLINRRYDLKSASTVVCNHHLLAERQRLALARIVSTDAALANREQKRLKTAPSSLFVDGFNTIITLEVALSGSILLQGMDGTIRDLAGLRGTYRIVDKTEMAVHLLLQQFQTLGVRRATIYLDQPVSNSGRLKSFLLDEAAHYPVELQVELLPAVDGALEGMKHVVSSDAIVLDKCRSWFNLNREIITTAIPNAWIVRLDENTKREPPVRQIPYPSFS